MTARLSVNVNDETATALRELAQRRGATVTETVRRSVAVLDYLQRRQDAGDQIRLVDDGDEITNVEIL